jgi:hypothetical protein
VTDERTDDRKLRADLRQAKQRVVELERSLQVAQERLTAMQARVLLLERVQQVTCRYR